MVIVHALWFLLPCFFPVFDIKTLRSLRLCGDLDFMDFNKCYEKQR